MTRRHSRGGRRNGPPGNRFRIIGGRWRGRRLAFPDGQDLRPTGDRVRETLFNWLAPLIEGSRCLDLFAGSGALGIEALSRGAAACTFVDTNRRACTAIEAHLKLLGEPSASVVHGAARDFLNGAPTPFDLVLLDPPFRAGNLPELCTLLEQGGWLADGARVYIEHAASEDTPTVPGNWAVSRSGPAGNVAYHLCIVE